MNRMLKSLTMSLLAPISTVHVRVLIQAGFHLRRGAHGAPDGPTPPPKPSMKNVFDAQMLVNTFIHLPLT